MKEVIVERSNVIENAVYVSLENESPDLSKYATAHITREQARSLRDKLNELALDDIIITVALDKNEADYIANNTWSSRGMKKVSEAVRAQR